MWNKSASTWLISFIAALYFFYEFLQMSLFNSISADLMQSFQLTPTELGWLSSIYFYAVILLVFPSGMLVDRFSARKLILITFSLSLIGSIGFATSHQFWQASLSRFISGMSHSFAFLLPMTIILKWIPKRHQALATGLLVTFAMLGGTVAQTPLLLLKNAIGWREALEVIAGIGVIFWLLMAWKVQDPETAIKSAPYSLDLFKVLRNRQNWLCGLYISLLNLPVVVLASLWGDFYLTHAKSLSAIQAANASSAIFIGMMLGSPLLGWVSDRIHSRRLLMSYSAIVGVVVILGVAFLAHTFIALLVLFFFLGVSSSAQVLSYPLLAENNPSQNIGTALGLASIIIMGSAAFFQVFFGKLISLPHGLTLGLLSIVVAFLLGAVLTKFIKSPTHEKISI